MGIIRTASKNKIFIEKIICLAKNLQDTKETVE